MLCVLLFLVTSGINSCEVERIYSLPLYFKIQSLLFASIWKCCLSLGFYNLNETEVRYLKNACPCQCQTWLTTSAFSLEMFQKWSEQNVVWPWKQKWFAWKSEVYAPCYPPPPTHTHSLVRGISPELLNLFLTKLGMMVYIIIMRWRVIQKNWFIIFKVKITSRAYTIKIWLFLLYLLNCWSICNQTWIASTAS